MQNSFFCRPPYPELYQLLNYAVIRMYVFSQGNEWISIYYFWPASTDLVYREISNSSENEIAIIKLQTN